MRVTEEKLRVSEVSRQQLQDKLTLAESHSGGGEMANAAAEALSKTHTAEIEVWNKIIFILFIKLCIIFWGFLLFYLFLFISGFKF